MEAVYPSNRNVFLNEFSIPVLETDFLCIWNNILVIRDSFSVCRNREIQFLKNNLISAGGNWFCG